MRARFEHRLGVQAPPDRIWEILADLSFWDGWNPTFPQAVGRLAIGETLTLTETLPHQEKRAVDFKVVDWVPHQQILLRAPEGFMTTRLQYFEIEQLSDRACIFAAGSILDGFGARWAAPRLGRSLKLGFGVMGEALKAKAESD